MNKNINASTEREQVMPEGAVERCFLPSVAESALGSTVVEAFGFTKGAREEHESFTLKNEETKGPGAAFRYMMERWAEVYRLQPDSSLIHASQG